MQSHCNGEQRSSAPPPEVPVWGKEKGGGGGVPSPSWSLGRIERRAKRTVRSDLRQTFGTGRQADYLGAPGDGVKLDLRTSLVGD